MVDKLIVYSNSSRGGSNTPTTRINDVELTTDLIAISSSDEHIFVLRDAGGPDSIKYRVEPGYGNLDESENAFDVSKIYRCSMINVTLTCMSTRSGRKMTFFMKALQGTEATYSYSPPITTIAAGKAFTVNINMIKNHAEKIQLGVDSENSFDLELSNVIFGISEGDA